MYKPFNKGEKGQARRFNGWILIIISFTKDLKNSDRSKIFDRSNIQDWSKIFLICGANRSLKLIYCVSFSAFDEGQTDINKSRVAFVPENIYSLSFNFQLANV